MSISLIVKAKGEPEQHLNHLACTQPIWGVNWEYVTYPIPIWDKVWHIYEPALQSWGFKGWVDGKYTVTKDDVNIIRWFATITVLRYMSEERSCIGWWAEKVAQNPTLNLWLLFNLAHRVTIANVNHTLLHPSVKKPTNIVKILADLEKPTGWDWEPLQKRSKFAEGGVLFHTFAKGNGNGYGQYNDYGTVNEKNWKEKYNELVEAYGQTDVTKA